jgi:hypothetical protein
LSVQEQPSARQLQDRPSAPTPIMSAP